MGLLEERVRILETALKRIALGTHVTLESGGIKSVPFGAGASQEIARHALALSKGSEG
jgi:hypothetical protein